MSRPADSAAWPYIIKHADENDALMALDPAGLDGVSVIGLREITLFKKLSSFFFAVAFLASGWGTVMAAALCPHEECMGRPAVVEHHGVHEVEAPAEEGCSKGAGLSGHESHEQAVEAITEQHSGHLFRGTGGHSGSCVHCAGAPSTPVRSGFVGEPSHARRDAARQAEPPAVSGVIPSVAAFPALRPTQGSPPGPSQRRHLLINVFLI